MDILNAEFGLFYVHGFQNSDLDHLLDGTSIKLHPLIIRTETYLGGSMKALNRRVKFEISVQNQN